MKYEARIQVEIADLSDAFFENIIVYELIRPSGALDRPWLYYYDIR